MKSIFLTSLFPNELFSEISEFSKGAIANANNELQWSLYIGLNAFFADLKLINFPNVGAFPLRYRTLNISDCEIHYQGENIGYSHSFVNFIYIKHHLKYLKTLKAIEMQLNLNKSQDFIIFIYDLYPPFLKAISKIKAKYPKHNIHVCLIVPDIYGLTGTKSNFYSYLPTMYDQKVIASSMKFIDSFVLIAEQMKNLLPILNKPWTVVEGIFKKPKVTSEYNSIINKIDLNCTNIFYSGAIDERNNIPNLLKAFQLIDNKDYQLIICGDGPLKSLVEKHSKEDSRIIYLGQLPHSDIVFLQGYMSLLVNPRLPGQDFTKYSFPSKTMEYLASATPCLMYRLEGVPSEYFRYCYTAEQGISHKQTIDLLAHKIQYILNLPSSERQRLADTAQCFILENKSPKKQCKKIYDMVSESMKVTL